MRTISGLSACGRPPPSSGSFSRRGCPENPEHLTRHLRPCDQRHTHRMPVAQTGAALEPEAWVPISPLPCLAWWPRPVTLSKPLQESQDTPGQSRASSQHSVTAHHHSPPILELFLTRPPQEGTLRSPAGHCCSKHSPWRSGGPSGTGTDARGGMWQRDAKTPFQLYRDPGGLEINPWLAGLLLVEVHFHWGERKKRRMWRSPHLGPAAFLGSQDYGPAPARVRKPRLGAQDHAGSAPPCACASVQRGAAGKPKH